MARGKVINDNVLGRIELSDLERALVGTPTFLRLARISQLGLASMVFPSATHTRAAHSLGVLHLVGRVCNQLGLTAVETRKLRLTGLLHDIGQYPLSHCIEGVYKNIAHRQIDDIPPFRNPQVLALPGASTLQAVGMWRTKKGEADDKHMGGYVIRHRSDVRKAFQETIGPRRGLALLEEVAQMVEGSALGEPLFRTLLDSDFDCDRLDYLQRDSVMTGVPYGHVDLEFLIENMTTARFPPTSPLRVLAVDRRKGLGTLEHYVLARYFMYSQVYFHKTVRSFEHLAKAAFLHMANEGFIYRDHQAVRKIVGRPEFLEFSDRYFFESCSRYLRSSVKHPTIVDCIQRIFDRRPLALAYELRELADGEKKSNLNHVELTLANSTNLQSIATHASLDPQQIVIDVVPSIEIVPFKSAVSSYDSLMLAITRVMRNEDDARPDINTCWVVDQLSGDLTLLAADEGSLLRTLRDKRLLLLRVYTTEGKEAAGRLRKAVEREVGSL